TPVAADLRDPEIAVRAATMLEMYVRVAAVGNSVMVPVELIVPMRATLGCWFEANQTFPASVVVRAVANSPEAAPGSLHSVMAPVAWVTRPILLAFRSVNQT